MDGWFHVFFKRWYASYHFDDICLRQINNPMKTLTTKAAVPNDLRSKRGVKCKESDEVKVSESLERESYLTTNCIWLGFAISVDYLFCDWGEKKAAEVFLNLTSLAAFTAVSYSCSVIAAVIDKICLQLRHENKNFHTWFNCFEARFDLADTTSLNMALGRVFLSAFHP